MSINPSEITKLLKDQIKNFGEKAEVSEIGKVLSFGSILRVAEDLNKKELQSLEIAVLYSKIPESIKKEIISPYISVDKDEARISVRIKDSLKNLKRNELINKIKLQINRKKKILPSNLFGDGNAAKKIVKILENVKVDIQKKLSY